MEYELSFTDALAVLRRRFWIVFLFIAIAAGAVAVLSYVVLPPIYESDTTLIVNDKQNVVQGTSSIDYGQIQTSQALAVTYAEIITSRAVLQDTINTLQLSETVKQLTKMTTVQVKGGTEIILVSVKDRDAIRAASIANAMANSFITQLPILVSRVENVSVIDGAVPMTDQVSPRPLLNIAMGMVVGLVLGVFVAFLVDNADDTVKTPDQIKELFGLRVLAAIPNMKTKGATYGRTH